MKCELENAMFDSPKMTVIFDIPLLSKESKWHHSNVL